MENQRPAPTLPVYRTGNFGAKNEGPSVRVARRASVHAVCVLAYRRHHDDGTGSCSACGETSPCQRRRNAGSVIEAYSDDPCRYDVPDGRLRLVARVASCSLGVLRG